MLQKHWECKHSRPRSFEICSPFMWMKFSVFIKLCCFRTKSSSEDRFHRPAYIGQSWGILSQFSTLAVVFCLCRISCIGRSDLKVCSNWCLIQDRCLLGGELDYIQYLPVLAFTYWCLYCFCEWFLLSCSWYTLVILQSGALWGIISHSLKNAVFGRDQWR